MEGFEATTRFDGPTVVIDMRGLLDRSAGPQLDDAFAEAVAADPTAIAFNFSEVEYINSTGIALVVGALARARALETPVRAFGLSEHYREIFTITRLSDFMGIYDDEAAAVAD